MLSLSGFSFIPSLSISAPFSLSRSEVVRIELKANLMMFGGSSLQL